jgi:DNA adenine methylase
MTSNPIKWHGGKHPLAKRFVAMMPPHLNYVEPFAGGLAVLLERDATRDWMADGSSQTLLSSERGSGEFVNDLDGELMNFWAVLKSPEQFARLVRTLEATPTGEPVFEAACKDAASLDPVDRAASFFVRCRQSRAATFKDFTTLAKSRTRRGMNELPSAWLTAIEGLPAIHARLQRVVLLNSPALEVIRRLDHELTLFYVDPPYLHETRATTGQYAHEMTADDHAALLEALASIKGKFMLSGYHSVMHDQWAAEHGFHLTEFKVANHASGGKTKRVMSECVWTNFEPRLPVDHRERRLRRAITSPTSAMNASTSVDGSGTVMGVTVPPLTIGK